MKIINKVNFTAEVSSNHSRDIKRCMDFIEKASVCGCSSVKFQLFKIEKLFSKEILSKSKKHQDRKKWELPLEYVPKLSKYCHDLGMNFSCTPFYIEAVKELEPYVDFYKIASYELLWKDLFVECVKTGKPLVFSTGMSTIAEIKDILDNKVPLQRFGKPEEIADLVLFLSSEKASFITGSCNVIDGGQTNFF